MTSLLVSSFGFKHAPPPEADLVLDVRFLPNPYYIEALRPCTGLDPATAAHVFHDGRAGALLRHLVPLVEFLLAQETGKVVAQRHVAVGCTGGRHRSVAIAEELARRLRRAGVAVRVTHRDLAAGDA